MSQDGKTIATELLTNYKKKIIEYINNYQGPENRLYLEYLSRAKPLPDEKITTTVMVPVGKGQAWERHQFTISCPSRVNFHFMGMNLTTAELTFSFPKELHGPNQVNPRIQFKATLPRPWIGSFGAYMGPGPVGMYPFDNPARMADEIARNAQEGLVDKMCDFLNNSKENAPRAIQANLDYLARRWNFLWEYSVQKDAVNRIPVPLYVIYDPTKKTSTAIMEVFVRKELWLPPAEAIMRYLEPLADASCYFDENGEFFEDGPHYFEDYLLSKIKKKPEGTGEEGEPAAFQAGKRKERDEFGFILSGKKSEGEFSSGDAGSYGLKIEENRRQQEADYQKRVIKSSVQKQQLEKSVKPAIEMYRNAQEWFAANQNLRHVIVGDPAALPLKLKGNVTFLLSLNPPFILSFARDQLRVKKSLTGAQAVDQLFDIFKTGYLRSGT